MRACAASRAVALRVSSSAEAGTGFGSLARRLPRSNVKGVGLLTVTGLSREQALNQEYGVSYNLLDMVESATDAAPFRFGDLTSIAPLLIRSASCECSDAAPLSATPPSISVSDILRGGV